MRISGETNVFITMTAYIPDGFASRQVIEFIEVSVFGEGEPAPFLGEVVA